MWHFGPPETVRENHLPYDYWWKNGNEKYAKIGSENRLALLGTNIPEIVKLLREQRLPSLLKHKSSINTCAAIWIKVTDFFMIQMVWVWNLYGKMCFWGESSEVIKWEKPQSATFELGYDKLKEILAKFLGKRLRVPKWPPYTTIILLDVKELESRFTAAVTACFWCC